MSSPNVKWGTLFPGQGSGGIYAGVAPYLFESGTTGNHGFGVRMHARKYDNTPDTIFASSAAADVVAHNRGVKILGSVSNQAKAISGFTWDKATNGVSAGVGTWDSKWTALFARMAAAGGTSVGLKFSQAVDTSGANLLGSYGGLTEPLFELIIEHEVDRPDKSTYGNATQFKAYFRHIHNLMVTAGVRSKFLLNFCITEYGLNTRLATVNSFYPGDDVVDVLGIDLYSDFNGSWAYDGSTTSTATAFAPTLAWVRTYNKPFNFPEFQEAESSNDTDMQTWFTNIATVLNSSANADVTCTGIYLWCQASSKYQNYNKINTDDPALGVAHLGKHNGIAAAIAATGGNAVIGSVAAVAPAAPTGISAVSSSDGKSITISVTAAPSITPAITGERIYLGDGITTALHRVDAAAGQPDHAVTTSFVVSGLTPGNTYSYSWTWVNSAGNSGFATDGSGNIRNITTTIPGTTAHAPNITTPPIVTVNATDSLEYDFSVGATDPQSLPLTYSWTFTSPTGNVIGPISGASGTTPELTEPGNWGYTAVAANTVPLSTPASGTFAVNLPGNTTTTKYFQWSKPQTGMLVRQLGPMLRGFMDSLDLELHKRVYKKGSPSFIQGLVGQAFDHAAIHSSNNQAMTSGWAYWTAVVLDDDHFDEIWFLSRTAAQVGSGTQIAVYDSTGSILPNGVYSGTNVDNAFKTSPVGAFSYQLASDSILPEQNLTPGNLYYIVAKNSAATTPAQLVVGSEPGTAAKLGDFGSLQPSFGAWNLGAGSLPANLPFLSWVNNLHVWMGLGASDYSPVT